MRSLLVFILFFCTKLALCQSTDVKQPVDVEVTATRISNDCNGSMCVPLMHLTAIIGSQTVELSTDKRHVKWSKKGGVELLLNPGHYKGMLVIDEHSTTYYTGQAYDFLYPDGKTERFYLVGLTSTH